MNVTDNFGDSLSLYQSNHTMLDFLLKGGHRLFPNINVQEKDINILLFKSNIPEKERKRMTYQLRAAFCTATTLTKAEGIRKELSELYSTNANHVSTISWSQFRPLLLILNNSIREDQCREIVREQMAKTARKSQPSVASFFVKVK